MVENGIPEPLCRTVARAHQIVPLLVAVPLLAAGCSTVDFVPSRSPDLPLARLLAEEVDRRRIRPWFEDPPTSIDSNVTIYYALELTDEAGTDQWLIRVLPTSDLKTGRARERRGNEEQTAEERRAFQLGLLGGLTAEYEDHSDRWLSELYTVDPEYRFGFEEDAAFVPVYADTYGPVRKGAVGASDGSPNWQRASRPIPVAPVFFAVDIPSTVARTRRLVELDPETADREERHRTLSAVALSKVKVAQGLIMILGNDALRAIAHRVIERPSPLAMAGTAMRWLTSSRPAMARWVGELSGLRFETLPPDSHLENQTGVETVRLRFEPQLSTTTLLKTEITAAPTDAAPMLSAGFVSVEGINPYDDTKRFALRLLGWARSSFPDERLLSSQAARFQFTPDGAALVSDWGEIWYLPTESGAPLPQVRPPAKRVGDWSKDGRYYVELQANGTTVEVIDLADPAAPGRSFHIPKSATLSDVDVSPDGRFVAFLRLREAEFVGVIHEFGRETPLREVPNALRMTIGSNGESSFVEVESAKADQTVDMIRVALPTAVRGATVPSSGKSEPSPTAPASVRTVDPELRRVTVTTPVGEISRTVSITPQQAWISADGRWLMVQGIDADGLSTHRLIELRPQRHAEPAHPAAETGP